eukprot:2008796-Amphidinium_carterae.1
MANMEKPPSHDILRSQIRVQCEEGKYRQEAEESWHRRHVNPGLERGGDDSGDGAGVMTQIPWDLYSAQLRMEGALAQKFEVS